MSREVGDNVANIQGESRPGVSVSPVEQEVLAEITAAVTWQGQLDARTITTLLNKRH